MSREIEIRPEGTTITYRPPAKLKPNSKRNRKRPIRNCQLALKCGVKTDFTGLPVNPFDKSNWGL